MSSILTNSSVTGASLHRSTAVDSSEWPKEWSVIEYRSADRNDLIPLAHENVELIMPLEECLKKRATSRSNVTGLLSMPEFSAILRAGVGLRQGSSERRTHPSAGARYPIETYCLAANVDLLPPGVYHYDQSGDGMRQIAIKDVREPLAQAFGNVDWISKARAVIVLVASPRRSEMKYGLRAERFIPIEAGHIAQNILLAATSISVPTACVGGFADGLLAKALKLTDPNDIPLYCVVFP